MLKKHPKSGKPLIRIQPLQKELACAISQDVFLVQAPSEPALPIVQSDCTAVGEADTVAVVECAAVGSLCASLPFASDEYFLDTVEPDLDSAGVGFGWDDPDDF